MPRPKKEICIVGRQGAMGFGFPNGKESFEAAIGLGCSETSSEVHLSADGKLIVHNDPDFSRLERINRRIADMTLSEIKEVRHPDGGEILTLEDLINICKNKIPLQVELKATGTPKPVYELLKKHGLSESSFISSFKLPLLEEIHVLDSSLKLLYLSRLPDTLPFDELKALSIDAVGIPASKTKKEHVDFIHKESFTCYAFGVTDEKQGRKMIRFGITTLITVYPQLFLQ